MSSAERGANFFTVKAHERTMDLDEEHLYKLIFTIIYPGVLGATLITYLRKDIPLFFNILSSNEIVVYPRLYFGLVFIFHWSLIYVIDVDILTKNNFGGSQFARYFGLSLFMLSAFYSLPLIPTAETEYFRFYLSIAGIGGTLSIIDLYEIKFSKNRFVGDTPYDDPYSDHQSLINLLLFIWGIGFSAGHEILPIISSNSFVANIFITGTLIASVLTLAGLEN